MKGRQRFECIECGLRISGRERRDGWIYACDRAPNNDEPPRPCICAACVEKTNRACVEVGSAPATKDRKDAQQ